MTITPSAALMDAIVLSVVARDGTYGYKITQDIRAVMEISESTLYPVLRRLQKDGCLDVYDQEFAGRNRRYYRITQQGQAQLAEAVEISDTYMGAIERGERSLTLDTLVRLVNRLGVTVDYLLADSVSDSDANIMEQFKQIMDQQPLERKQMAINVLRTIFAYFGGEGA